MAQYHAQPGTLHFTLNDANYNVIALTDSTGSLVEQYRYEPYGTRYAADEDHDGDGTLALVAAPDDPSSPLLNHYGHQGLLFDPVTGLIHNRAREYGPILMRFMQRDPNQTALTIGSVLSRNAQTQLVFLSLTGAGQYGDGMSLYQYAGSNPIRWRDPSGTALALERATTAAIVAGLATIGLFATHSLIQQIASLTANISAYQAVTNLFAFDVDLGIEFGGRKHLRRRIIRRTIWLRPRQMRYAQPRSG